VDKLLSSFREYIRRHVLLLNAEDDLIRTNLQNADERVTSLIALLQKKKAAYEGSKTVESKDELKRVQVE
jgi:hypothetical protein